MEPPSPIELERPLSPLSPTASSVNSDDLLFSFFDKLYDKEILLAFDDEEFDSQADVYRIFGDRGYMYEFKNESKRYLMKLSADADIKGPIKNEREFYTQLYEILKNNPDYRKYFIEGVAGGEYVYQELTYEYIIIPFIENTPLDIYITQRPDIKKLCDILYSVKEGLLFLFNNGLCHGDMHSGNVLITESGVLIIDFDTAGGCNERIETGFMDKSRKDVNFIGKPANPTTGFFIMCKNIFTFLNRKEGEDIQEIIDTYLEDGDIGKAYDDLSTVINTIRNSQTGARRLRNTRRLKAKRKAKGQGKTKTRTRTKKTSISMKKKIYR
jgi:serine/threonine protein kinase